MNTQINGLGLIALALMMSLWSGPLRADEALRNCAACHALERPETVTLQDRINRKGPDLYYAGNKYRQDWLLGWLQNPKRLWPGGLFFAPHTKVTDDGDIIDASTLIDHPKLTARQAASVTKRLMALRTNKSGEATKPYQPKSAPKRLATMNFRKFKGCGACHQDASGYGGVSGPELYTAFKRLQPAYIASFIRDPLAWDSKSLMPRRQLINTEIQKLVGYLKLLAEENP